MQGPVQGREADDPIMISALEHWAYCPRQCGLIHLEQEFADNIHTARGHALHARVDDPGWEGQPGARVERSLPVWSDRLGLIGKCDVVEFRSDGTVYPVEYKHGVKREKPHDDLQLAAQAICLEEMTGVAVTRGAIFHHASRRRREVVITEELRRLVEEAVAAVRAMLNSGRLPPPVNDKRCRACSLKEICQPQMLSSDVTIRTLRTHLFDSRD